MTEKQTTRDESLAELHSHKARSEKLRARIAQLRSRIEFQMKDGTRLFYSVDFSEIYSYLHYGDHNVADLGANLTSGDKQTVLKDKNQHYLALTHLFNSFSKSPLYLLQPYLLEMYSYTKNQAHRSIRVDKDLDRQIKDFLNGLRKEHVDVLRSVKAQEISSEDGKKLLELFVNEYPPFSILLLEYERWHSQSTRGQLLKKMLAEKKLTNRIDEIFSLYNLDPRALQAPLLEDENKIADAFPGQVDAEKRQSRKVDARALLILRNINHLLEPHGARLILVTRDLKSPAVAEQMENEEWFAWKDVRRYFCDIASVYLDLLLHPLTPEEKLAWLDVADAELAEIVNSVDHLIEDLADNIHMPSQRLSDSAHELLDRNSHNWSRLLDMEFIRVSPEISWLGEDFVRKELLGEKGTDNENAQKIDPKTESLLKKITDLVDSPTVQQLASDDLDDLWGNISGDVLEMRVLSEFSGDVLGYLKELLSQKTDSPRLFASAVARSRSFTNMPEIHFKNKQYGNFIAGFQPWKYSRDQIIEEVGKELTSLFALAVANQKNAESYLFMAYILGMLDNWSNAIQMAEHGRKFLNAVNPEFNYFLAYAIWQAQKKSDEDHQTALVNYLWATELMWEALRANPYDPRYLKRQGTIALECHYLINEIKKRGQQLPEQLIKGEVKLATETEALGSLEQALKRVPEKPGAKQLRVRILNNLAYSYGTLDEPNLEKAEKYLQAVVEELSDVKENPNSILPEFEKWQFVMDTRWYIGAKLAYSRHDLNALEESIANLINLRDRAGLNTSEKHFIESHLADSREWLAELKNGTQHQV
jgi:hypothetical protein